MIPSRFEQIVEDFQFLENWQDRYGYIIDLGKALPELEDALRVQATKVHGCASQVWMVAEIARSSTGTAFRFRGDSDAIIVRGLIAVLGALYNGTDLSDVPAIDAVSQLKRLDLENHLSAQRSNGLQAMVARIQSMAREHL
ncbi:MAG: SufE family protein [Rhodobacteraceae bacterium]|nr:SufE family protein [Paracoccaceae bacterium]